MAEHDPSEAMSNLALKNSKPLKVLGKANQILQVMPEKFAPYDSASAPILSSGLPPEIWNIVQSAAARFTPEYFLDVSRNLLENPNLTASHLARAELSYTSFNDATFNPKAATSLELADIIKHLRAEHRPKIIEGGIDGYELTWTVVRKLIPRNPKLDDTMVQTCHLFTSTAEVNVNDPVSGRQETLEAERNLVIYIPHIDNPESVPYYHPKVRRLAILYTYFPSLSNNPSSILPSSGHLSIYFDLFPTYPLDNRLSRTALKLLEVIHKHSRGRQAGYKKRVHHDQIIPQKPFQDTYAYLKGKYAKTLIEGWVEQTPPSKHVFEDLGISAFLMELWVDMYGTQELSGEEKIKSAQEKFPGFVDIGCGNGLLVYILNSEGWTGWGFDARRRKTWDTFSSEYAEKLEEMLLIPEVLNTQQRPPVEATEATETSLPQSHNGVFSPGTFIISNHADELTPWTPLIASLSSSPFIAIPCCSHDFGGTRFRAPAIKKYVPDDKQPKGNKGAQPSAYASLCSWTSALTESMGYVVEREHLRIPSTRNIAIVGRTFSKENDGEGLGERLQSARNVVEKEMGGNISIEQVRLQWVTRGNGLMKPGKGGH